MLWARQKEVAGPWQFPKINNKLCKVTIRAEDRPPGPLRPVRADQSGNCLAAPQVADDLADEAKRGVNPAVVTAPLLSERVHAVAATAVVEREEFGAEVILLARKNVNCVRAPERVQLLEEGPVDHPVVVIIELGNVVR